MATAGTLRKEKYELVKQTKAPVIQEFTSADKLG